MLHQLSRLLPPGTRRVETLAAGCRCATWPRHLLRKYLCTSAQAAMHVQPPDCCCHTYGAITSAVDLSTEDEVVAAN